MTGFVKFPHAIAQDPTLSIGAKGLLAVLLSHANGDGECWPGYPTLCREAAVSRSTLRTYTSELEGRGLVHHKRRRNRTNVYTIPPRQDVPVSGRSESQLSGIPETERPETVLPIVQNLNANKNQEQEPVTTCNPLSYSPPGKAEGVMVGVAIRPEPSPPPNTPPPTSAPPPSPLAEAIASTCWPGTTLTGRQLETVRQATATIANLGGRADDVLRRYQAISQEIGRPAKPWHLANNWIEKEKKRDPRELPTSDDFAAFNRRRMDELRRSTVPHLQKLDGEDGEVARPR